MKLTGVERTKIARRVFLDRVTKFLLQPGRLEPCKRQMRRKRPLFMGDAEFFRGLVDIGRQSFKIRRALDAGPENARMFFVGEKTEPAKIERNRLIGTREGESVSNGGEFCFRHFNNEFERHVKILRAHPASLRRNRAKGLEQSREIFPYRRGKLQRNKQTHGSSGPFGTARRRLPAVVEEMDAHQIK